MAGEGAGDLVWREVVRPYLPISPYISLTWSGVKLYALYLRISPYISVYLPHLVWSEVVRPYLPISPYISLYLPHLVRREVVRLGPAVVEGGEPRLGDMRRYGEI